MYDYVVEVTMKQALLSNEILGACDGMVASGGDMMVYHVGEGRSYKKRGRHPIQSVAF